MKKSIVIIRNASKQDFGGGERMPVDLASELLNNGYSPVVVSRSSKLLAYANSKEIITVRGWWWAQQNWSGYRIIFIPIYIGWQILLFCWYLYTFIRIRPRIVHAQSKDDFIAGSIAAKVIGARVVWSDHADLKYIFQNVCVWYKNPIGKLVKICTKLAKRIILTSQNDKRMIEDSLGKKLGENFTIIYNGVADRPELVDNGPAKKSTVFAATSRLVTEKGIRELIEAFNKISPDFPNAKLELIGDGPEKENFKRLFGNNSKIIFHGHLDDPLKQLAKADIFIHPSYMEGFSLSIVEAAMLAKPIIACDVGGNSEIIKNNDTGLLIRPKNTEDLADAMKKLANSPRLRTELGQKARKMYEKKYIFQKIVKEKYLPLYEE